VENRDKRLKILYKTISIIIAIFLSIFCVLFLINTFFKRMYPLEYKEQVIETSISFDVNPYLVFAVIKIESDFNEKAESNKGAKGLMQLTPKTAEYMAEKIGIEEFDLINPKDNLLLGVAYISYLTKRFENLDTVICAYNAGEGNVSKWLKDSKYSSDGKNLQNVPFEETERYLKKFQKTFLKYNKLYRNIVDKR